MSVQDFIPEYPTGPLEFSLHRKYVKGKIRPVAEPSPALRELHAALLDYLERLDVALPSATGSVKGQSPITNATCHAESIYFYVLDLKDAFPSVTPDRVSRVLVSLDPTLGSEGEVASFLEQYFFIDGHGLAQGGPASPMLFNLYCESEIDQQVRELLSEKRSDGTPIITYTRYVDDLVFSSPARPIPKVLRRKIRHIIGAAGFSVNHQKSRLLKRGQDAIEITGIRISPSGHLHFAGSFKAHFAEELYRFLGLDESGKGEELRRMQGLLAHYWDIRRHVSPSRSTRQLDSAAMKVERWIRERREAHRLSRPTQGARRLPQEFLEMLKGKVALSDYIGRRVRLKKRGRNFFGLCPFHLEKTPSFSVNDEKGFYHCFGCGMHGSVIDFAMRTNDMDFLSAVKELASYAGIPFPREKAAP